MTLHDLVQWPVLPDRAVQVALRLGYRLMRHWWRRFPPRHHRGAGILVRDGERVLIVRHSYRPGYGLPGGRVQPGEAPRDAAMRELSEECAIAAPAEALRYLGEVNRTHIYEYRPARPPRIRIDNREVIEALFLSPAEATARNRYLRPFMELVG